MADKARVVIIGGGVTGCSVAYHLAKKGLRDVVLCEQSELAAGATTFAAGHVILYTLNEAVARLNQYGVELYASLQEVTGQDPGFHRCGNMRFATHRNRFEEFHRYQGVAEVTGACAQILSAAEAVALNPLAEEAGILAALYNPDDGYISPTDLNQALAAGARGLGVDIRRHTPVTGITELADGGWRVSTPQGEIDAEQVVSCTGNFANNTMGMLGRTSPSVPVKHQYIITESLPILESRCAEGLPEVPVCRDPEQSFYVRQESTSLVMGCYEAVGEPAYVYDSPNPGGATLFEDQLDKLLPYLELAMERFPVLGETGIKNVINSAMPYAPDDLPVLGPLPGKKNFWLAEGSPFGITLAGGIGWQMAEWIVEGEPSINLMSCDSRRFGDFSTRSYSAITTKEAYEQTYRLPKPDQQPEAGRPLKCSPLHDLLRQKGAVFGAANGWERPNWFALNGIEAEDDFSTWPPNYFNAVDAECHALREGAGLVDMSVMSLYQIDGSDARSAITELLNITGMLETGSILAGGYEPADRVLAGLTLVRKGDDCFWILGEPELDGFLNHVLPIRLVGDVRIERLSGRWGALALAGPKSREVLTEAAVEDVGSDAFSNNTAQKLTLGLAAVYACRTGLGGELGWYLLCPAEYLRHVFLTLTTGAQAPSLIGVRALRSLGVEKATTKRRADGGLDACLVFDDSNPLPLAGSETVRSTQGKIIGSTTTVAYGHTIGKSLAMARLQDCDPSVGDVEVRVAGEWRPAHIITEASWDPSGERLLS